MEEDPDCAVMPCILLWLRLLGSSGKRGESEVTDLVQRSKSALGVREHTMREHELVVAIEWLAEGDLEQACHAIERCLVYAPADAMLLKFQNDVCLFGGFSQRMRDAIGRSLPAMDPAQTPMFSYVLGMRAFSLEETGDTGSAISVAKVALEQNQADAWALHALAHALNEEGRGAEVLELLQRTEPYWSKSNLKCHMGWHWGLCYLEMGQMQKAMIHYDQRLAPNLTVFGVFSLIDCTQFLLRIEMLKGSEESPEGWDVAGIAARWEPVSSYAFQFVSHHRHAFNDAHIGIAVVASRDDHMQGQALQECESLLQKGSSSEAGITARAVGSVVCLPLMRANIAWRTGNAQKCVEQLLAVRYHIQRIGGSVAQRDLWNLLLIRASLDCAAGQVSGELGGDSYFATLAAQLCHERLFATPPHCGTKGGSCAETSGVEGGSMLSRRLLAEARSHVSKS
jgi:tetratricopeptide (TPR) repeat protein